MSHDVPITDPCTHYLVKWAGYPTSSSSWTPAFLCSKALVDLYRQHQSRRTTNLGKSQIPAVSSIVDRPSPLATASAATIAVISEADRPSHERSSALPGYPSATATSLGVSKKSRVLQTFDDGLIVQPGITINTIQDLKQRISDLNPDCEIRHRSRDRRVLQPDIDSVRLGCKHVQPAAHPCRLQIYYDIPRGSTDAVPTNIRRYIAGTCSSNVCICCMCPLSHDKLVENLFFPCF
jgi:hypothetical protein